MTARLRQWVRSSPVYNYNQRLRDRWVAAAAATIPAGSTILDVGAGSAPYRTLFSHCTYETQDFGKLDDHQLLGLRGYAPITYVCDATAIPVPPGTFDVVLCTEVLEHVPDPMALVREFARILKPSGTLLMSAPLGSGLHQEPYHFYGGFTPHWYERFLGESGFTDIRCTPNGAFYRLYGQETIRLSRMLAIQRHRWWQAPLLLPLWLAALVAAVVFPPLATLLDRLDPHPTMTCGYHVRARRAGATVAS